MRTAPERTQAVLCFSRFSDIILMEFTVFLAPGYVSILSDRPMVLKPSPAVRRNTTFGRLEACIHYGIDRRCDQRVDILL